MKDLLNRLSSRTLWVTIGTILVLVAEEQYTEAAAVAIAYVTGEKALDAVQTRSGAKMHYEAPKIADDVDTSQIETGVGRVRTHDEIEE